MNEDILGGLKSALTRGYSLEEAMLSFFNAGYKREDIEEAAKALQVQAEHKEIDWQPEPIWVTKQRLEGKAISSQSSLSARSKQEVPEKEKIPTSEIIGEIPQINKPTLVKKQISPKEVSSYTNVSSRIKTITWILVILLLLLVGILGIIFVFKQQIIDFFNSLF